MRGLDTSITAKVLKVLTPTIKIAVEETVQSGIQQHKQELQTQVHRLTLAEHMIPSLEDALLQTQTDLDSATQHTKTIMAKLDDLEYLSHRSHIRIISIPEIIRLHL